jgi:hypothetical protein
MPLPPDYFALFCNFPQVFDGTLCIGIAHSEVQQLIEDAMQPEMLTDPPDLRRQDAADWIVEQLRNDAHGMIGDRQRSVELLLAVLLMVEAQHGRDALHIVANGAGYYIACERGPLDANGQADVRVRGGDITRQAAEQLVQRGELLATAASLPTPVTIH